MLNIPFDPESPSQIPENPFDDDTEDGNYYG